MDLSAICEALKATQLQDGEARKLAEQQLDAAASGSPDQLVEALSRVLASPPAQVADELRQEAAVILRQLVLGLATRPSVWDDLKEATKKEAMKQLLATAETDPNSKVRRNVGHVISAIGTTLAEDFDELQKEWPEILPALSRFTGSGSEVSTRVVGLGVLKNLAPTIADGMLAQGNHAVTMLAATLSDQTPEVRAAGAQLMLQLVEVTKHTEPLMQLMPAFVSILQGLATTQYEDMLKDTLEVLISAAEADPDFFKDSKCLKELSETLLKICSAGAEAFSDEDIRHSAMEAVMSLAVGLAEDVAKPEGLPLLETLVGLNIAWMLEVEEDIDVWTAEGKEKDEDDCDDDAVGIGEENMDRLAEHFAEELLMPIIFKVIRGAMQLQDATWKTTRSAVMALAQVVEHLEEEAYVDQCVEFIVPHLGHAHPRVRYAAFWAVGQVCYDQSPHVQQTHHEVLLPAMVAGMDDTNIRVATAAVFSFAALVEELDCDDIEPHMEELLMRLFQRLQAGESRALQEHCLSGIAYIAEAAEDLFVPYYQSVMPMLKQVISKCTSDDERSLHGKAFECASRIGQTVGKEVFLSDAQEVMAAMMPLAKDGFAADDPRREAFHEAAGIIASTLGKDFKPYVGALLPSIFNVLKQRPVENPEDDDDDDDDDSLDENLRMLGLKTSVLEEMEDALDLTDTLIQALEEEFCEFMPATCQNLLPLLDMQLSEDLRERVFKTWEFLAECACGAVASGRINANVLQELVQEFLKKTVGAMMTDPKMDDEASCTLLQAQAAGVSGVIRKAGEGVLSRDSVKDIVTVVVQLLDRIQCPLDTPAEPGVHRRRGGPAPEEDSDGDEKEPEDDTPVTAQTVRFSLCDVAGALMRANRDDFIEVALPTFMEVVKQLVRPERSESDRSLALYIADDVVACLGERSVPYWNSFMNEALAGMVDRSAVIRQFAASTIGNGAEHAVFAPVAPAAASQVHKVLQKHGERHRRRRAVKADAKQTALAVDASIRALGQICENHEKQLGTDAGTAWSMWLANLPLKYNLDAGKAAHTQLVRLVVRNHQFLTAQQQLPRVLTIFADIYKSRFSTSDLDKEIAAAVASVGEDSLQQLISGFPEKQRKKVEQMLKSCAKAGA